MISHYVGWKSTLCGLVYNGREMRIWGDLGNLSTLDCAQCKTLYVVLGGKVHLYFMNNFGSMA